MSSQVKPLTRGGTPWEPLFVTAVDQSTCLGCGRCYKVCPRDVFDLVECDGAEDDEMYHGFGDEVIMVMTLANADDCIGCGACSRVCPKSCHTHTAASEL